MFNKYPDKVCQLWLVAPFPQRWWMYKEITKSKDIQFVYPFEGVFNQLYDSLKKPFAVNSSNPIFSDVKDYNSFYAFDKFNGIKLKDFCDGAIMLAPFDKIEPVRVISNWVTNQKELDEVKNILPNADAKQIITFQDLMNYIAPTKGQEAIKKPHDLKKIW